MRTPEPDQPARLRGLLPDRRTGLTPPTGWSSRAAAWLPWLLIWSCGSSVASAQSSPQYLDSSTRAQQRSGQFVASGREADVPPVGNAVASSNASTLRPTLPQEAWTAPSHSTPPSANAQANDESLRPIPRSTQAASTPSVVPASATAPREPARSPATPESNDSRNRIRNPLAQADDAESENSSATNRSSGTLQMLLSIGSSLLIVISLFLGLAWFYRKTLNTTMGGGVPKQVVQVLGRTPIAARQQLVVVRFGSKLVLVSLVQGEARTISEITDPSEVDQLAGMCESAQPGSISSSFRSILNQGGPTA